MCFISDFIQRKDAEDYQKYYSAVDGMNKALKQRKEKSSVKTDKFIGKTFAPTEEISVINVMGNKISLTPSTLFKITGEVNPNYSCLIIRGPSELLSTVFYLSKSKFQAALQTGNIT